MKKNGFLLNELLISFAISAVIMLAIFSTTITLNKRLSNLYIENKARSQQIILNRKIAYNFSNSELTNISKTGSTYTLSFGDVQTIIEVNKDSKYIYITNSGVKEKIVLNENMQINNEITFECSNIGTNKYLTSIKIPMTYSDSNEDFGIEQYNITSTACGTNGLPTS